tara:strand:- start:2662 stop:3618 length:957 start_codon:yes stop_codon:yes gene_type:complete
MKQLTTRAYNKISRKPLLSTLVKESSTTRLANEINYYNEISKTKALPAFCRKIKNYKKNDVHYLELEEYPYDDLGRQMVTENMAPREIGRKWESIASRLDELLTFFASQRTEAEQAQACREYMYTEKTEKYYSELVENFKIFKFLEKQDHLLINNQKLLGFKKIWRGIKQSLNENFINSKPLSIIHGDLCFSNILYSGRGQVVRLIDPRGSFGSSTIFGDPLYDLAKLSHSYRGRYEYLISDRFTIAHHGNEISFRYANKNAVYINEEFLNFKKFKDPRVKVIEGLIFIGMCSRHYDSMDRQLAMYGTALELLNDCVS